MCRLAGRVYHGLVVYSEQPPGQRGQQPWKLYASPLRYPGGKRKLANFMKLLVTSNGLADGEYAEVYAGGAAVALELLYEEYVRRIHINDIDRGVHAFWMAATEQTDSLLALVRDTPVTIDQWRKQRDIYLSADPAPLELGFATLFLNRTNRSGIVTGGPIGGYRQEGTWRIDARYRVEDIVNRIEKVGRFAARIEVTRLDGAVFLRDIAPKLPDGSLVYLDPPYFVKGQEALYASYYSADDHAVIAGLVLELDLPWVVSYDDAPEIRALYPKVDHVAYSIAYSAHARYRGSEIAFFSESLRVPEIANPSTVTKRDLAAART